jgi:hypothetical protein
MRKYFLYVDIRESVEKFAISDLQFAIGTCRFFELNRRGRQRLRRERNHRERPKSQIGNRNSQILRPSGDHSAVDPPVPIPNTEVKRCSPDGSATIGCARVGRRQNKKPGEFISSGFLLCRRLLEPRIRPAERPANRRLGPRG